MKTPKIKLIITLLIIAAGVALFIIGYCVLPETLVMQITASGQGGNTMPKLLGLLIPFAINTIFTIIYFKSENLYTFYIFHHQGNRLLQN